MEKVSTFKDRLRLAMNNINISQAELARKIDMDKSNVSFWLNGRNEARAEILIRLSKILKVNSEWLEGYDVPKKGEISYFYEKIELLNDEGKRKVEVYVDDLLDNPKYKKLPAVKLPKLNIA